jgi:hypothetical protein
MNKKPQEKEAVTRDIRTNKLHQKFYSNYHAKVCKIPGVSVLNSIGNWNRITTGMNGHTRSKLKSSLDRLESIRSDYTLAVDEYNITAIFSACFGPTTKKHIYRNGHQEEVKGAVVCFNDFATMPQLSTEIKMVVISLSRRHKHDYVGIPYPTSDLR